MVTSYAEKSFPNSSQIKHIKYVEDDKILTITFVNDKKYNYFDVPKETFDKAVKAESIGKYVNANVKGIYKYQAI